MKAIKKLVKNKEFLVDFLSTATYGSTWFAFGTHQDTPKEVYENAKAMNEYREGVWADVLLHGGFFLVEDIEEEKDYKVSLKDIEKGVETFMAEYPRMYTRLVEEEYDYFDADALLQTIVFGEIVFG